MTCALPVRLRSRFVPVLVPEGRQGRLGWLRRTLGNARRNRHPTTQARFQKLPPAWHANIGANGRPSRLASKADGGEQAYGEYHAKMAGRQPVDNADPVLDLLECFVDHHARKSAPATYQFYARPVNSFARFIGPQTPPC